MWKIYQDKIVSNDGYGNCTNACIASILELRLNELPDIRPTDPYYHYKWRMALADLGYKLEIYLTDQDDVEDNDEIPKGYAIASILTNRVYPEDHKKAGQNIPHSVVMWEGVLVHDPFPLGSEITKVNYYQVLTPLTESEKLTHLLSKSKRLEDKTDE